MRPSYLYNGKAYIGNMASLYWDDSQVPANERRLNICNMLMGWFLFGARAFEITMKTVSQLEWKEIVLTQDQVSTMTQEMQETFIVRRAGLLWSQQDFEWRWSVPLFKCLTVLEFSFILFELCLLITFFNFIMNYVPIVTFWIFTYHKVWILSIMFCFIWSYWIIYFLACLEVSWRVVS